MKELSPAEIAEQTIDLFLEYRDRHDKDEDEARNLAILEVSEGCAVKPEDLAPARPVILNAAYILAEIRAGIAEARSEPCPF